MNSFLRLLSENWSFDQKISCNFPNIFGHLEPQFLIPTKLTWILQTKDFGFEELFDLAEVTSILNRIGTSRERPKSALYLRLKIVKGDALGFLKLQLVAKKNEKNEGRTPGRLLKTPEKKI